MTAISLMAMTTTTKMLMIMMATVIVVEITAMTAMRDRSNSAPDNDVLSMKY